LLGLLALAGVAAALVYVLARTWREGGLEQRLIAVAAGGALTGFALHNMLDAGNPWKASAIALALIGAIVARAYGEREHALSAAERPASGDLRNAVDRYSRPAIGALLVALLVVPFAGWYWTDRAHFDYYRGADAYNRGEPGAIERLQEAVDADSSNVAYRLLLGQALARAYMDGGAEDALLIDRAVVHLEQAVQLDERSDIARANLARAYQLAGETTRAGGAGRPPGRPSRAARACRGRGVRGDRA
jgi:predicted Zn-dependent protease